MAENNKVAFSSILKKTFQNTIDSAVNKLIVRTINRFITRLIAPLLMAALVTVFAGQAHAAKPDHGGASKGKGRTSEQIKKDPRHRTTEEHREDRYRDREPTEQGRDRAEEKHQTMKENRGEVSDDSPGLNKQHDMKTEQEQKELGKGSEKGQEMREEHRRKWWRFWGE